MRPDHREFLLQFLTKETLLACVHESVDNATSIKAQDLEKALRRVGGVHRLG